MICRYRLSTKEALNPKGFTATTGLIRVGVGELETTTNQSIAVVQHQTI